VIGQAAEEGHAPHAWELPWVAGWYFHDQVYRQRLVVAQESALPVAVRQGDLAGQAMARQHLGWLRFLLGDIVSADDHLAEADALARQLDDGRLRGLAGLSRAYVLQSQNQLREAMTQVERALRLCHTADPRGNAHARYALGWHVVQLRDRQHALNFTSQVLMLYRESLCAADC
jgi:tetratricopeptide (TPR) repeat protein